MSNFPIKPQYLLLFICSMACFCLSSCTEEGCTDKAALNYDSLADKDDGSCQYCDQTNLQQQFDLNVVDDNTSSIYFNQIIARVHLTRNKKQFRFASCGDDTCKIYVDVENLKPKGLNFSYTVYLSGSSHGNDNITIPAYQTLRRDSFISTTAFSNTCASELNESEVVLNSSIDYF